MGAVCSNVDDSGKRESFEVHLFEKGDRIGLDAGSVNVAGVDGKEYRVDSPMRAVQGGYYTRLLRLYRKLGIELQRTDFNYSFINVSRATTISSLGEKTGRPEKTSGQLPHKRTAFIYNGKSGVSLRPFSFPSIPVHMDGLAISLCHYAQSLIQVIIFALSYFYILLLAQYHYHFHHTSRSSKHWLASATYSQFLHRSGMPASFSREILTPLFSCVATCSPADLLDYPAAELLEYIVKTFGQAHWVVKGGVRDVVHKLLHNIPQDGIDSRVHLACRLVHLQRSRIDDNKLELLDSQGESWHFDHVIFATQANQARHLLRTYYKSLVDEPERDLELLRYEQWRQDALGQFQYTQTMVMCHYDPASVLPHDTCDRRMLNIATREDPSNTGHLDEKFKYDPSKQVSAEHIMATHDLSILHPALRSPFGEPLLQTTNPTVPIAEDQIISRQVFDRAILTKSSREALKWFLDCEGERSCQGRGGIWFVGSWAAEGIPLLEGCVASAERVSNAIRCP